MMIILLILISLSLDSVWMLLGENCCWSLLALKGLIHTHVLFLVKSIFIVVPSVGSFEP